MKILSVAEKPSVAKELANIIGRGGAVRRSGHSPYNHIFDVVDCEFMGRRASMSITSVTGHMMGLEFDSRFKSWQGVNPEELFTAEVRKTIPDDKQGIKRTLEEEGRDATVLLLWLDCDLEGENIAYEVIDVATTRNKRLDIYRAKFSALIPRDIFRTLQHPERPNKHMSDAVDARQEIDLRLGAAFTRFQTMRLQGKFDALRDNVISYGPCQFPTLGFVVERYLTIQSFVAEEYWTITCEFETPDKDERTGMLKTVFYWERNRIFDRLACLLLYEMCIEIGSAVVTDCNARPTTRVRPCPLNTVELQKRASRYLRMSSETTMKVAEGLYQRGFISYPRTETDFFKEGFELLPLLEDHRNHNVWGNFVTLLLNNGKYQWPRHGGHDDQAHPPIHPTKSVPLDTFTDQQEKQVYELVCRHFLACCARDAVGQQTTLRIQFSRSAHDVMDVEDEYCDGDNLQKWLLDGEAFKATGLMIEERNWLDVYDKWEKWSGNKVATLKVGDTFDPQCMQMKANKTQPPLPLTESDLISAMDRNGIGTDATIAQHITTIQERSYAFKDENGRFIPSELGIGLVEGYNLMGYQLNKPSLRASMERNCQSVARGQMTKEDMVRNCLTQMRECYRNCVQEAALLDNALGKHFQGIGQGAASQYNMITRNVSACGVCHNGMDLKVSAVDHSSSGNKLPSRFLFCNTCQTVLTVPKSGEFIQLEDLCPICDYQILMVRNTETGKEHTICPYCFDNPPLEYSEGGISGGFRCFTCSHPTCSRAGRKGQGKHPFAKCFEVQCDGSLNIRYIDGKGFVAGCSNYPKCKSSWWLPKCLRTVEPSEGSTCKQCSQAPKSKGAVHKLHVTTIRNLVQPCVPPEDTVCPCCSLLWEDLRHKPMPLPQSNSHRVSSVNGRYESNSTAQISARAENDREQYLEPNNGHWNQKKSTNWNQGSHWNRNEAKSDDVKCDCGLPAASRTVSKDGPNQGRAFFTCGNPKMDGCRFFQWIDGQTKAFNSSIGNVSKFEKGSGMVLSNAPLRHPTHISRHENNTSESKNSACLCGLPSVRLTVNKAGPNQGKTFFKCPKPKDQQCNYFEWTDKSDVVAVSSKARLQYGAGSRQDARNGLEVTCSRCKQVGHYARSCPQRQK